MAAHLVFFSARLARCLSGNRWLFDRPRLDPECNIWACILSNDLSQSAKRVNGRLNRACDAYEAAWIPPPSISYLNHGRAHKSPRYRISLDSSESNKTYFAIVPRLPIVCANDRAIFRIHHDYTRPFYRGSPLCSRMIPNVLFDDWCQVSLRQLTFIAFNDHHSITLTGKYVYFPIIMLGDLHKKE